jgi:hypothetical protein
MRNHTKEATDALVQSIDALEKMKRALKQTMPGVRFIACQDYAILNDAPLAADKALAKALAALR